MNADDPLDQAKLSRRELLAQAGGAGLVASPIAATLAGCGVDEPPDDSDPPATGGTFRLGTQAPSGPLDPLNLLDLGSFNLVAQCLEYLVGAEGDDIGPMLATEWSANGDATEWTFLLRDDVSWHDGTPFTAADVVASVERFAASGSAFVDAITSVAVSSENAWAVIITLSTPNASLPYLLSIYTPGSAILPASWASGDTLDATPTGTGPFKLTAYDAFSRATFERNDDWWGGAVSLEGAELVFFSQLDAALNAFVTGAVDGLHQISPLDADLLLEDLEFTLVETNATSHRQIWMGHDEGQFTDVRVREALALSLDRQQLIDVLLSGRGAIANDHVVFDSFGCHDPDAVPQRTRDLVRARALLTEAGYPDGLTATLHAVAIGEIPDLAELVRVQAAEAGFTLEVEVTPPQDFYGTWWCPQFNPCRGSAELGIVDYGHRPTPDVFLLNAYQSNGVWNSSQYGSAELDEALADYLSTADPTARRATCARIQAILSSELPALIAYRIHHLAGHSTAFRDVGFTAMGQALLAKAALVDPGGA